MPHPADQLGEGRLVVKLTVRANTHEDVENAAKVFGGETVISDYLGNLGHKDTVEVSVHRVIVNVSDVREDFEKSDHVGVLNRTFVLLAKRLDNLGD